MCFVTFCINLLGAFSLLNDETGVSACVNIGYVSLCALSGLWTTVVVVFFSCQANWLEASDYDYTGCFWTQLLCMWMALALLWTEVHSSMKMLKYLIKWLVCFPFIEIIVTGHKNLFFVFSNKTQWRMKKKESMTQIYGETAVFFLTSVVYRSKIAPYFVWFNVIRNKCNFHGTPILNHTIFGRLKMDASL